MKHTDFKIGNSFMSAGGIFKWYCTDVGTRVIIAIRTDTWMTGVEDKSWLSGPPYAVNEVVFDEDDMLDCSPLNKD